MSCYLNLAPGLRKGLEIKLVSPGVMLSLLQQEIFVAEMTVCQPRNILGFHFRLNKILLHFIAMTHSLHVRKNSEALT